MWLWGQGKGDSLCLFSYPRDNNDHNNGHWTDELYTTAEILTRILYNGV